MGNRPTRPEPEEAEQLEADFKKNCALSAFALFEADVIILVTGAGFSADSGLAVYADVAKVKAYEERDLTYQAICAPQWLHSEPELFYGFWGQCFNDYRNTQPHEGYNIIKRWRDAKDSGRVAFELRQRSRFFAKEIEEKARDAIEEGMPGAHSLLTRPEPYDVEGHAGAFFTFTSNVDAHSFDVFHANEIREIHGNVELWQCSQPSCCRGGEQIFRAPLEHSFVVDTETMLAPLGSSGSPQPIPAATSNKSDESSTTEEKENDAKQSVTPEHSFMDTDTTPASPGRSGSPQPIPAAQASKLPEPSATEEKEKDAKQNVTAEQESTACISMTLGRERQQPLRFMQGSHRNNEGYDFTQNHPRCRFCGGFARPAILMFDDLSWVDNDAQDQRWHIWNESLISLCEDRAEASGEDHGKEPLKICILEIGCGDRVRTCRMQSEEMLGTLAGHGGEVTLVRVNPDFPLADDPDYSDSVISIMSRGLNAIREIDQVFSRLSETGPCSG